MAERTVVTELSIRRLARDIARDILDTSEILRNHQLTLIQFEQMISSKQFQMFLEEELAGWTSDQRARIQAKAMAIVEEGLVTLFDIIHDPAQTTLSKIEALKFAARMASMEQGAMNTSPDERIVFNINIGVHKLRYEQQRVEPRVIEGEAEVITQPGKS